MFLKMGYLNFVNFVEFCWINCSICKVKQILDPFSLNWLYLNMKCFLTIGCLHFAPVLERNTSIFHCKYLECKANIRPLFIELGISWPILAWNVLLKCGCSLFGNFAPFGKKYSLFHYQYFKFKVKIRTLFI